MSTTSNSEIKETPAQRIVKSAQHYFDHYQENHKFDNDDCDDSSNVYEQFFGCNGISVQNSYGVSISKLRILRHEIDEDLEMGIYDYDLELTFTSPDTIVEHSQPTLDECCLCFYQLPTALEKLFNDFKKIKFCTKCYGINRTEIHDICEKCNIKELLDIPEIKCTICLEETRNYITLPCNHCFHISCFSKVKNTFLSALNKCSRQCPLCRAHIEIKNEHTLEINLLTLPKYENTGIVDVSCESTENLENVDGENNI